MCIAAQLIVADARGQSGTADQAAEAARKAKELNRNGVAMLDAGDLERALEYFLESRRVLPTTKNTTNSAVVLDMLGRYDEALELYEELLLKYAGGLEDADREAVAPAMATLRGKVGTIDVRSNVGGSVFIDGKPRGKLPLSPVRVMPGKHKLRVVRVGYATHEREFEVQAAQSTVADAKLEPLDGVGVLAVENVDGTPAKVFFDGSELGSTPFEGAVKPGKHLVWLRGAEGRGSAPTWIEVVERQTALSRMQLRPLGHPTTVRVEPRSEAFEIGGIPLGPGSWEGQLPAGKYVLTASEPGYFPVTRQVELSPGAAPVQIQVKLEVDPDHPRWPRESGKVIAEALVGPLVGPTLAGGAGLDCPEACESTTPALGLIAGARTGFRFPIDLGIEFGLGYLSIWQTIDRRESSKYGDAAYTAEYRLHDEIHVHGPFAMAGFSYRHSIGPFFFGARATAGAVITFSRDEVSGTASAQPAPGQAQGPIVPVFVEKPGDTLLAAAPFVAPEANLGIHAGPVDVGLGLTALFFPAVGPRIERGRFGPVAGEGASEEGAIQNAQESTVIEGERAYGRFVLFSPMVTLGADF